MSKYLILLIFVGIYLISLPLYCDILQGKQALLWTGNVDDGRGTSSGTNERVGVSNVVSIGVFHTYWMGESLPIYINYGNRVVDVRILHEIFFEWVPMLLGGILILSIGFDLYVYWGRKRKGE